MEDKGCDKCNDSGYKGRIALYGVMPLGDELKEFILEGASSMELKRAGKKSGMKTLRQSGLEKIPNGVTTVDEIVRVSASDEDFRAK